MGDAADHITETWGDMFEADELCHNESADHHRLKQNLYTKAEQAKTGQKINCPNCRKKILKRTYNQKFCCTRCKDQYWNSSPDRIERTKFYNN